MTENTVTNESQNGTQTATVDHEDAALNRIFGEATGEDETPQPLFPTFGQVSSPPPPAEGDPNSPHPTKDSEDQPSSSESEPDEPAAAPTQRSEEEAAAFERALAALRRAKVPTEGWDDQKIIDVGTGIAASQSYTDRLATELGELRKGASKPDESRSGESVRAEPPPPTVDLAELKKPLVEALGDEAGEAVTGLVQGAVGDVLKSVTSQRDEMAQAFQHVRGIAHMLTMDRARQRLQERFPQLSEGDAWNALQKKATAFLQGGGYDDRDYFSAYDSAFEDAARSVYGSPVDQAKKKAVDAARSKGQPMTSNRSGEAKTSFSSIDEREDAVLDAIMRGDKDSAAQLANVPIK